MKLENFELFFIEKKLTRYLAMVSLWFIIFIALLLAFYLKDINYLHQLDKKITDVSALFLTNTKEIYAGKMVIKKYKKDYANFNYSFIKPQPLSTLLNEITTLSEKNNLLIVEFKPYTSTTEDVMTAQPIEMNLIGNYLKIINFFRDLEKLSLIYFDTVHISALPNRSDDNTLQLSLKIKTYSLQATV